MGTVILSEHGALPQRVERIAEIIQDFDPDLRLEWIPPEDRTVFDGKPFRIVHDPGHVPQYVVISLSEDEVDHRVLASLFRSRMDDRNLNAELEAHDAALKAIKLREQLDQQEEEKKFAVWALRQNKRVKHNGVVYE